jgi:hypothetical protein
LNGFRRELGLAPVNNSFGGYIHSPQVVIGLFSDRFAPMQRDWPPNLHLPVFVLYDATAHVETSSEAEEFRSDAGILERCRNFAAQIQSETALEKACSLIEELAARPA